MESNLNRDSIQIFASSDLAYDQRVLKIARSLHRLGFKVTVTGRLLSDSAQMDLEGIAVHRIRMIFVSGFLFYVELNFRFFFRVLTSSSGMLWAVDLDTLPAVCTGSFFSKRKVIYDAHEHFVESPELVGRPQVRKIWGLLARIFIPTVNTAITVNEVLAEKMSSEYGVSFQTLRNMPPANFIGKSGPSKSKTIWYQGALNKGRCLEMLISSLVYLPDYRVELAGTGDLKDLLVLLAEDKGVSERVTFHGRLEYDDMQRKASACFLGFNLLEPLGQSYYFSLANKFFDYIQAGLPSINPAFPVYEKYLGRYSVGECQSFKGPKDLAKWVDELQSDASRYEKYRGSCAEAASDWTWEKETEKLVTIVESI